MKNGLAMQATQILPIDAAITQGAMSLIDQYALSHGLQLADALIAATALEHRLTLLTANAKHFGAVATLPIEVFMP